MKLGAALELEDGAGGGDANVTPACKKPRLAEEIANGLMITPPPPLTERQSVSCFHVIVFYLRFGLVSPIQHLEGSQMYL